MNLFSHYKITIRLSFLRNQEFKVNKIVKV